MMEYKNARYTEYGTIEVDVNHPNLGWIPFHAMPDDSEDHGRALFEELKNVAAPYVHPES